MDEIVEEVVEEVKEEVEVVSDEVEAEPKEEVDTYGDEPVDDEVEVKKDKDTDDKDKSGEEKKTDDKSGDDTSEEDDEYGGLPEGVKKRIKRAVKDKHDSDRKVSSLEKENAYLKGLKDGGKEEPKEELVVDVAPKEEDYDEYTDYLKASSKYEVKIAVKEALAVKETEDKATEAETTKDTRKETHRKRVEAAMEIHPDYAEKVFVDDGSLPISDEMYENIVDSDKGAEVAYYLAEHPGEAQEIYDLDSPRAVSRAMGRIEDKVSIPQKTTTKKVTSAPEPISPGPGGKSVSKKKVEDMSMAEYMKHEDAREAALER